MNKKKTLNEIQRFYKSKNSFRPLAAIMSIAFIGLLISQFVSAAANSISIELESSSAIVSSPAQRFSDQSASGGQAIKFGSRNVSTPGIPAQFIGGYLESWTGVYPSQIDSRYTLLFHAFATVNGDGSVNMDLWAYNRQQLANEYKAFKAQGKPVILSVGGASGAQAGLTNSTQVQNFINSINPLINEFEFSGIDWDLEMNVPGGISVDGLVSASRQLKNTYGNGFAITMAPFEGMEYPYKDIARQLGNDLTFVGFQYYNMEQKVNSQNAIARMEEWMNDANLRPDQFSIGFWYGPDDWQHYTVEETQMASIYQSVKAKYPQVRGTWTWAIAGCDRPRNYAFAANLTNVVY